MPYDHAIDFARAVNERADLAHEILQRANAVDVDARRGDWARGGWSRFDERTEPDERYPTF